MKLIGEYKSIRYVIAGSTAAAVHFGLLFLFKEYLGLWYITASSLAFLFALLVSFTLQKYWTFKEKSFESIKIQFPFYAIVAIFNFLLNASLLFSLVHYLKINYLISQAFVSVVLAISSFFVYNKMIFSERQKNQPS